MIFGYARVSTSDQQLHLQTDALQAYGCVEVTQEKVSSAKECPVLQHLLTRLRPGDTLVVWKLDRLGRSLKDRVTLVSFSSKAYILSACRTIWTRPRPRAGSCSICLPGWLSSSVTLSVSVLGRA